LTADAGISTQEEQTTLLTQFTGKKATTVCCKTGVNTDIITCIPSDVNKDLTLKAKDQDKD